MPFTGHCLCRAVTYISSASEPNVVAYCHCDDCQRHSGSTYALFIIVPLDAVTINGPIQTFSKEGSSGNPVLRNFCRNCGSSIFDKALNAPKELAIMGGSLDMSQKRALKPSTELWTASKLAFCQEHLGEAHVYMPE